MLGWRVLFILIGGFFGALVGLFLVGLTQWMAGLVLLLSAGMTVGGVCGWTIFPHFFNTIDRWKARLLENQKAGKMPTPPPPGVVRLGLSLGMAEGIVIGAINGGWLAAVFGGFVGGQFGIGIAVLSWAVRRHISVLVFALLAGFLIEVVGCLLIATYIQQIAAFPLVLWITAVTVIASSIRPLCSRFFKKGETLGEENSDACENLQ